MLLTEFLETANQTQYENAALLLSRIEWWMRLSRTDAAKLCRFNPATVTALSTGLLEAGLIQECGRAQSGSGRKPIYLELKPDAGHTISLLLQASNSRLTFHNLHHELVSALLFPPLMKEDDLELYASSIMRHIDACIPPGPLGLCLVSGRDYLGGQRLMEGLSARLAAHFSFPIYHFNAESMTCLAEGQLYRPSADANIVTLSITSHTVRIGVLSCEQLLFQRFAPGNPGLDIASGQPINDCIALRSISTRAYQYVLNHSGCSYTAADLLGRDKPHAYLCGLAREGDPHAQAVLAEYAGTLAILLNNVCQLYAPDLLVLDGEVLEYLDLLYEGIKAQLSAVTPSGASLPLITTPQLGKLSPEYGASRYCLQQALKGRR